jgi:hypothetical protein
MNRAVKQYTHRVISKSYFDNTMEGDKKAIEKIGSVYY